MELSATIQATRGWEGTALTLATKHHPSVVGNQTGENDTIVVSMTHHPPPLKGGSIHFHHQKPRNANVHIGVSATLHFFLGRSSNLLLAGLQIFSWQVFKSSLGRTSNLYLAGLQIFSWL